MNDYAWWYGTARWRKRARMQLREHPLCCRCLVDGNIVPGYAADHVEPHRGDSKLFWEGALQTLCKQHHNVIKQREELRGYSSDIDADGWPVDPKHPCHRR
jgi:5-methylcytosine-specific restriction enzyme A